MAHSLLENSDGVFLICVLAEAVIFFLEGDDLLLEIVVLLLEIAVLLLEIAEFFLEEPVFLQGIFGGLGS